MKYEDLGLADKPMWRDAFAVGYQQILGMVEGNEKQAGSIYRSRVLSIAKTLQDNCDNVTDESVAVALMNMGAPRLFREPELRAKFNDKVMDILVLRSAGAPDFSENMRDARRTSMAEQIVIMEHQMEKWKAVDRHHQTRVNMVQSFAQNLEAYRAMGVGAADPRLLALYEEKLEDAKAGMARLEQKAQQQRQQGGGKGPRL